MDIIHLLAGTGAKAPLTGKATGNAEPGTQFASILENATSVHGHASPKGLALLAASDPRATTAAKETADQALRAKFGPAALLASKDVKTESGDAPKADPKDAQKSDGKDPPKVGKKADADDKGKHAKNADVAAPNTPIAAAIHSALAAVAAQSGQDAKTDNAKGAASVQKAAEAKTGKLADADTRSGSRHQLQQLQQTHQTVTSAATSGHAASDAGTSSGGQGFASQLLSATDASVQAAAPTHADNSAASSAINGLLTTNALPQAATPAAPATVPTAMLQAPVGSMPWQNELGQQLIRFSQRGEHQIELQLHPKELGPLVISLHVNDQVAQAHFFAAHAQVRDAVQQAIPQLREALAGQGIALGEAMVGQQQQQRQDSSSFGASSSSASFGGTTEVESIASTRPVTGVLPRVGGGGVDLYA
ncbi:MAG TPA: flagellar hook-length control protein FliK [Rhodanobacteraceae bacterium]|nr:flagellar hook-length control protein FliK [Rhodanobacteraceae bacterium]